MVCIVVRVFGFIVVELFMMCDIVDCEIFVVDVIFLMVVWGDINVCIFLLFYFYWLVWFGL